MLAGEPATTFYNRDGSTYRGLTALKLHAEVEWQALNLWARFTRDGEQYASRAINVAPRPQGNSRLREIDVSETGYQQLTLHMNYEQEFSQQWRHEYTLSYDMHNFERIQWNRTNPAVRSEAHREEEAFLKFLTR